MIEFVPLSLEVGAIRFGKDVSLQDAQNLAKQVAEHISTAPRPCVYAVDARKVSLFAPDVSRALIDLMRADNPNITRTAVLLTPGATFGLQVERMFREADNPARQAFHEMNDLMGWLRQVASTPACQKIVELFAQH